MSDQSTTLRTFFEENVGVKGAGALTVLGLAAASYYMTSRPLQLTPPVDLDNQSTELEDGSHINSYKKTGGKLMHYLYDDVRTLYDAFQRGIRQSNDGPCLGARTGPDREYEWMSYKEVYEKARAFGSGLIHKGLKPGTATLIGIYSKNKIEWTVAEQTNYMYSMVTVPLNDTLGDQALQYIINECQLSTVICDIPSKAQILLDQADQLPSLKLIIMIDGISKENEETASKHGVEVSTFNDVERLGRDNPKECFLPKPSDLALVCFTSGTTGDPKGVMLTHGNLISNASAMTFHLQGYVDLTPSDRHLSYMPLSHVYERHMQILLLTEGSQIGFYSGDIKLLTDDMQTLKPSFFPTVPRLLNKFYDKVMVEVSHSIIRSTLLSWAVKTKMTEIRNGLIRKDTIWDWLLFRKIRESLGGNIRFILSGSAPLSPQVLDFMRAAFGCLVLESYGQTEAASGISYNVPGETKSGHVGIPLACNAVRLFDVPEMGYYASHKQGEICIKGPNVFMGYYKHPEKTAEAVDEDGWLHTGDVGEWLPEGTLRIIDRKKNIFKLAQGEYIACEKIENVYMGSEFVAQCFVEGNSTQSNIMGVVTLDEEYMAKWVHKHGITMTTAEMAKHPDVKSAVLASMLSVGKKRGLKGFEQVKDIYIHPEQFSVENALLTGSLKKKRLALRKAFQKHIDDLYAKN